MRAARALIGVPFRPRGRDPVRGVDCVGVVVLAHAGAGRTVLAPDDYPLRGWSGDRVLRWAARAGFRQVAEPRAGDVALLPQPFGHWHLGIVGGGDGEGRTLIHAHAGLRRVVETPVDGGLPGRGFRLDPFHHAGE